MAGFVEKQFTCALCGDQFKALAGALPPADPVCMHCGMKYSDEKRRRLIEERKKTGGRR